MSKFCVKCGTPLYDADHFCPTCGARTNEPSAPFAPPTPAPYAAANASGEKDSSVWLVLLIIFAVIFVTEILLMLFWHPGFLAS